MNDKQYGLGVINLAFPQFADLIEENDGELPEDNYRALSIYVNGASSYGITETELEQAASRHGIPLHILRKAKETGATA